MFNNLLEPALNLVVFLLRSASISDMANISPRFRPTHAVEARYSAAPALCGTDA